MRLPAIVLLILLCFSTTLAQLKQVVEDKGTFGLHVVDDRIINHKYLERENQLLLIGYRHVQVLDLTNFKVIETRPIDLPSSRDLLPGHSQTDWTISPDGRHLVLIGLEEARSRLEFSPDGKYFAVDVGKDLQSYETETGKLRVELTNVELPSWGWMDNDTLASIDYKQKNFFEQGLQLKAFDANDGRLLFKQRLEYEEGTSPRSFDADETIVTDTTTLRPHPNKKIFLTTSNQFAKIYDSRTGALLQIVVQPLIKIDLMGKPRKTHGHTVLSADWSKDGKTLYVFSANRQSVSLWRLIN